MMSFAHKTKMEENHQRNKISNLRQKPNFSEFQSLQSEDSFIQRKAGCSCGGGCPSCQTKGANIPVSQPTDASEIEADQIADKVMRMTNNETSPQAATANDFGMIQRKALPPGRNLPSRSPAHVRNAISSGGSPMKMHTRNFFESRFGYDFSRVRVHTGSNAEHSVKALNAKAYTIGNNIVFGENKYRPETESGRALIAHELVHTIQQNGQINRQRDDQETNPGGVGDEGSTDVIPSPPPREESGADVDADIDEPVSATPATQTPTAKAVPEITLETGNNVHPVQFLNNLLHQQICVARGAPYRKRCFSFAAVGAQLPQFSSTWLGWSSIVAGAIIKGQVYEPAPVPGATIANRHTVTLAQATNWLNYITSSRYGLQDGYSIGRHSCRTYSQWEFRDAPLHW